MHTNEIDYVKSTLTNLGYHTHIPLIDDMGRDEYLISFSNSNKVLSDYYFYLGKAYFRRQVPNQGIIKDLGMKDENLELAFLNFYTAASFG